jgi:hypothetical protein
MQHDIYSLGVLLLELGLWQSFITYPNPPSSSPTSSSSSSDTKQAELHDPTTPIPPPFITQHASEKDIRKRATAIKAHLISLASEMLPARMGRKYADIVLLCLRCLDSPPPFGLPVGGEGGEDDRGSYCGTGGEFEDVFDEDGIVVGVRYIEKILLKMQEISV